MFNKMTLISQKLKCCLSNFCFSSVAMNEDDDICKILAKSENYKSTPKPLEVSVVNATRKYQKK